MFMCRLRTSYPGCMGKLHVTVMCASASLPKALASSKEFIAYGSATLYNLGVKKVGDNAYNIFCVN